MPGVLTVAHLPGLRGPGLPALVSKSWLQREKEVGAPASSVHGWFGRLLSDVDSLIPDSPSAPGACTSDLFVCFFVYGGFIDR